MIKTFKWVGRTLFLNPAALRLVMMVTLLFASIPPVQEVIGPYVKILLAWGAAVLACDLFTDRRALRNRYAGFLILFMIAYAISIWLNRAAGVSENLSVYLYTVVFFFVLFAYDPRRSAEETAREARIYARVFVAVTALFSLFCLYTFLFSVQYKYVQQTTPQYTTLVVIGVSDNRLWGLYNPNTGSMLNFLSSVFSLLLLVGGSRRWSARAAHLLNLALQYVCMILTLSRAPWYMYAVFWALFVFFVLPRWRRAKKHPLLGEMGQAVLAVVAGVLVIALSVPVKAVMSYAPAAVQSLLTEEETPQEEEGGQADEESGRVELSRTENTNDAAVGILTGRQHLWYGGWRAFLSHPLFGTSRAGLYDAAQAHVPDYWKSNLLRGGLHNVAIMTLACGGAVGLLLMAAFVLVSLGRAAKWLLRRRGEREAMLTNTLTLLVVTILGVEMLESRILYTVTIFGAVFWTAYGYLMRLADECEPEKAARTGLWARAQRRLAGRRA